jgi:hypothetical protein
MKAPLRLLAAVPLALAVAASALAADPPPSNSPKPDPAKPGPEVLERDSSGRPTKVRIEGQVYTVCTAAGQDGCINPREAGLGSGTVPLDHWPGKPASDGK